MKGESISLHRFVNHNLSWLFLERESLIKEEDVSSNVTDYKVSWVIKFMRNRDWVGVYAAINRMCIVYTMAQQKKQQHE